MSQVSKWLAWQAKSNGTKISPIQMPHMAPIQASHGPIQRPHTGTPFKREPLVVEQWARYQNDWHDEMSSMVPRSAPYDHPIQPLFKPLTALFRSPIQKWYVSCRKTSQVSKWSGQQAEFIGTKISPLWLPHMVPVQASYSPIQNPLMAPYSPVQGRTSGHTEIRKVSKWSACQDECSDTKINPVWLPHMGPIQAPYGPIQNPLTAPFRGDNFPIQHHKIHQNVQLNKQRKMHPLRPPEHSQQPNQWHSKQYVQSLCLLENPEAVDMKNVQGLWIWCI